MKHAQGAPRTNMVQSSSKLGSCKCDGVDVDACSPTCLLIACSCLLPERVLTMWLICGAWTLRTVFADVK